MMADDGPTEMDLGNVSGYDTKSTQGDSDTSNDMSYEDVCHRLESVQGQQEIRKVGIERVRNMASWQRS